MGKFRSDIQCIRGLSLLFVFVYHYNKFILPAGFIGVDIFFLISGYVNILSLVSKKNNLYFVFLFNRLKRLFPVSHLTLVFAILMVKRTNLLYQNKHFLDIIYAILSISNYRYIFLSVDYLSQSEPQSIVMHYWSLAVEDQFYILFPLYISHLYKNSVYLISIIFISLLYSSFINIKFHNISYFSFLSRSWQLYLGVLVSKDIYFLKIFKNNDILLLIIILFCFLIKNDILFPSPLSLFPLLLISLIITSKSNSCLLNNKILLELGNASYSFYMLHFIIIYNYNNAKKRISNFLYIILLTLMATYIMFNYYEKPIRKITSSVIIVCCYFFSLFVIVYLCKVYINRNIDYMNMKFKFYSSESINKTLSFSDYYNKYYHIKSHKMIYSPIFIKDYCRKFQTTQCLCPFKSNSYMERIKKYPIILLLTDSHGEQWFNILIPYSREMNYVVIHVWFWESTIFNKNFKNIYKLFHLIPKVNYIVISHRLTEKSNKTIFQVNFFNYIEILLKYSDEIYVIHDTPHFKDNPNLCLLSESDYNKCYSYIGVNATCYTFPIYKSNKVHYINMIKYICLNSYKCYYIWNCIPIYIDNNHLSYQFTDTLSKILLKYIHFKRQKNKITLNCNKSYKCGLSRDL